jgi:TIR domain
MEDKKLHIFISHKMPDDTELAKNIGKKLGNHSSNVIVKSGGEIYQGSEWFGEIQKELNKADWLILLLTDKTDNLDFCIFECGYFRSKMTQEEQETQNKRLLIFRHKDISIDGVLRHFNATTVDDSDTSMVKDLLLEIYKKKSNLHSDIDDKELENTAQEITKLFKDSKTQVNSYESPGFKFELKITDEYTDLLKSGKLPQDMTISGTGKWAEVFGKELQGDTNIKWTDLTKGINKIEIYEFLLAKMLCETIINNKTPKPMWFRSSEKIDNIYRITLSKQKIQANTDCCINFTASQYIEIFDTAKYSDDEQKEIILFNLVYLIRVFSRLVIHDNLERLKEIKSNPNSKDKIKQIIEKYDETVFNLNQITIRSLMRGIHNIKNIEEAIGDPIDNKSLFDDIFNYRDLQRETMETIEQGVKVSKKINTNNPEEEKAINNSEEMKELNNGLDKVIDNLEKMRKLNSDLYKAVLKQYSNYVDKILHEP